MKRFKNILIDLLTPGSNPEIFDWCRKVAKRSERESIEIAHNWGGILPEFPEGIPAEKVVSSEKQRNLG